MKAPLPAVRVHARLALRRATARARSLPDFLVIGAQRAGTSSLYNALVRHPLVVRAAVKEVQYFSLFSEKGDGWYRAHFPLRARLRAGQRTGEATPYYLFHPRAAERAAAVVPEARLVVLLRDPVERAISQYHFQRRLGFEPLETFEAALDAEEERLAPELPRVLDEPGFAGFAHQHFSYVSRGEYAEQLERWFAVFPRERFLILESGELWSDPAGSYAKTLAFLGLPPHELGYPHRNAGDYPEIDPAIRARLRDRFAPSNERLFDLLGRRFDWS
ncbi:MAG TPA: sulfotransferase domain-containing protein [Gaiellaceae bacterium]|nr:sulfotransferase domain-containing protein [Gaiellaceae bacterium]